MIDRYSSQILFPGIGKEVERLGDNCAIIIGCGDIKMRIGLHCATAAHKTLGTYRDKPVEIASFKAEKDYQEVEIYEAPRFMLLGGG